MNALIKQLARTTRYDALTEWIGEQVFINRYETIKQDIEDAFASSFWDQSALIEVDKRRRTMAFAKYGIVDLRFALTSEWMWHGDNDGVGLLRQLHLIPPLAADDLIRDFQQSKLEELVNDTIQNNVYAMLFLKSAVRSTSDVLLTQSDALSGYFVVEDACVTNARMVWLNKHFYI